MDFRILHFSASFYIELLIFVVNLYEAAILGQCWLVRCDGSSVSQHAIHLVTLIVDARSLSQIHHTKFNQKGEPGILYTLHKGYPQNRGENGCLENDIKAGTNILRAAWTWATTLWATGNFGHWELGPPGTWATGNLSTWELGPPGNLGHRELGPPGTWAPGNLGHLGTWATGNLGHREQSAKIQTVPSVYLYPHFTSRCPRAQIQ